MFFGGCGATAFVHAKSAAQTVDGVTEVGALSDPLAVPAGAYVEIDAVFERVPSRLADPAASLLSIEDLSEEYSDRAPLIGYCTGTACPPLGRPVRVSARVCGPGDPLGCSIPRELREAPQDRVLFVGETPDDARKRMMRALGVSAGALVVYAGLIVLSRRRRQGPPRDVLERTFASRIPAEELAPALRRLAPTDRFLVVEDSPGRLVFLQGRSENAARGWGLRSAEHFPRRAIVTWASSPREATQVSLRVEEDLRWWPFALNATLAGHARASLVRTAEQVAITLHAS
jgi:hypothetical protein